MVSLIKLVFVLLPFGMAETGCFNNLSITFNCLFQLAISL